MCKRGRGVWRWLWACCMCWQLGWAMAASPVVDATALTQQPLVLTQSLAILEDPQRQWKSTFTRKTPRVR